ncbi:MAG: FHA domain-containing protein [Deltaproteobacteria bacterium]|nr:FHA domain-containing protein [Deltaproteobacteria bacterium]
MARVLIEEEGAPVRYYRLVTDAVVIGRADTADLVLPDTGVSRTHALIGRRGDGWYIEDKGSANGTQLNGSPVAEAPIGPGDIVVVGKFSLRLELEDEGEGAEYTDPSGNLGDDLTSPAIPVSEILAAQQAAAGAAPGAGPATAAPHLLGTDGVRYDLSGKVLAFGRDIPVTGVLPFFSAGEIRAVEGGWLVKQGFVLTPVEVNGKNVASHRLVEGDQLRVGGTRFTYHGP